MENEDGTISNKDCVECTNKKIISDLKTINNFILEFAVDRRKIENELIVSTQKVKEYETSTTKVLVENTNLLHTVISNFEKDNEIKVKNGTEKILKKNDLLAELWEATLPQRLELDKLSSKSYKAKQIFKNSIYLLIIAGILGIIGWYLERTINNQDKILYKLNQVEIRQQSLDYLLELHQTKDNGN